MEIVKDISIERQLEDTISMIKSILGDNLMGIYLYGSIVLGGLKADSDLDIFVIVKENLSQTCRNKLSLELLSLSGKIGNKEGKRYLEITIVSIKEIESKTYPIECEYMYGEWLRDYIEEGQVLKSFFDYDLTILLHQVRRSSITLYGLDAKDFIEDIGLDDIQVAIKKLLPRMSKELVGDERNIILTLCRMYHTSYGGEIIPKDRAAEYILPEIPHDLKYLVEMARLGYLGLCKDTYYKDDENVDRLVKFIMDLILERIR